METIRHQSMDLFDGAARWGDAPRFFLPNADHSAYTPVTWQQYAGDTEALGGHLCARIKPGDSVAIMGQTSYAWIVAYSATQAVRGVVVPIYPASTPDMIAYSWSTANAAPCSATPASCPCSARFLWPVLKR